MDRAVANASRSWFLALKLPVPLDPLARRIACPDLAEPSITPYVTLSPHFLRTTSAYTPGLGRLVALFLYVSRNERYRCKLR